MTNRYELSLQEVSKGILIDAIRFLPSCRASIERDLTRLSTLVKARGSSLFTVDLPALGKHFDICLSRGLYTPPSLPISRRRRPGSVIPGLFQGMLIEVFDDLGSVLPSPNVTAISFLRQIYYFAKKFKAECPKTATYAAVKEFMLVEESLPYPTLNWAGEDVSWTEDVVSKLSFDSANFSPDNSEGFLPQGITSALLHHLQLTADFVSKTLGEFRSEDWNPGHGPGAVSDLRYGQFKFKFPGWSRKLDAVFPWSDFAFANHSLWVDDLISGRVPNEELGISKLIAVPKTQKTPRLIAAEPTANQYCQQAIWSYLKDRTRQTWLSKFISFDDQRPNQVLARSASKTGSHWTIDLSSASDRLSCRVVERMFRGNISLLKALHASRTHWLRQDIDKASPRLLQLKKFSTQGSACTFPIETVVFLTICLATSLYVRGDAVNHKNISRLAGEVRVFGDDLIVPNYAGELVRSLLGYLFFKVNEAKTFGFGSFRESCGLDVYGGVDVTPSYFVRTFDTSKPESYVSTVEQSNNFFLRGLWATTEVIQSTVRDKYLLISRIGSGYFGLRSFVGSKSNSICWDKNLQRVTCKVRVIRDSSRRKSEDHFGALLQYFLEEPDPQKKWVSGSQRRPKLKLVLGRVDANTI